MPSRLDEIDITILDQLQRDGRITRTRLARLVGRSVPAVSARMRKLEDKGVLVGFYAAVDAGKLRRDVTAFSWIALRTRRDERAFARYAEQLDEVLEVHAVTDATAVVLKVRTHSTTTLQELVERMESRPGVRQVATSVVLATHKETRHIPLRGLQPDEAPQNGQVEDLCLKDLSVQAEPEGQNPKKH